MISHTHLDASTLLPADQTIEAFIHQAMQKKNKELEELQQFILTIQQNRELKKPWDSEVKIKIIEMGQELAKAQQSIKQEVEKDGKICDDLKKEMQETMELQQEIERVEQDRVVINEEKVEIRKEADQIKQKQRKNLKNLNKVQQGFKALDTEIKQLEQTHKEIGEQFTHIEQEQKNISEETKHLGEVRASVARDHAEIRQQHKHIQQNLNPYRKVLKNAQHIATHINQYALKAMNQAKEVVNQAANKISTKVSSGWSKISHLPKRLIQRVWQIFSKLVREQPLICLCLGGCLLCGVRKSPIACTILTIPLIYIFQNRMIQLAKGYLNFSISVL